MVFRLDRAIGELQFLVFNHGRLLNFVPELAYIRTVCQYWPVRRPERGLPLAPKRNDFLMPPFIRTCADSMMSAIWHIDSRLPRSSGLRLTWDMGYICKLSADANLPRFQTSIESLHECGAQMEAALIDPRSNYDVLTYGCLPRLREELLTGALDRFPVAEIPIAAADVIR